jgi:lipopolysaccharide/colanic/teichoic acid biosynthesis glycosyltransferase
MKKRIFDLSIASFLIILLSPIFFLLSFLILLNLGRPIIFKQFRSGMNGRPFLMYKFRTMSNISKSGKEEIPDHLRLSSFGKIIRATSLDELPTLWNVMKGEMSIVGPRPLLTEYLKLYNKYQRRRLQLKPGVTGLAQISGRNRISWTEKFNLDIWYIDNQNLWLDTKILAITLIKVFFLRDINEEGKVTMSKFKGNNK